MSCDIGQPQYHKCIKRQKNHGFLLSHLQGFFLSFCTLVTLWLVNVTQVFSKSNIAYW